VGFSAFVDSRYSLAGAGRAIGRRAVYLLCLVDYCAILRGQPGPSIQRPAATGTPRVFGIFGKPVELRTDAPFKNETPKTARGDKEPEWAFLIHFRTQGPGRLILPPPNFSDSLRPSTTTAKRWSSYCRSRLRPPPRRRAAWWTRAVSFATPNITRWAERLGAEVW